MEGKALTDNIIRNIVSEVLRECKNHRIRASKEFISYYISLLQLDPNRDLTYQSLLSREKVQTFIKYIVEQLDSKCDPNIITLRLQHEFRIYMKELDLTVSEFRNRCHTKLYPLMLDIVEQDRTNKCEKLYEKICYYIILASGLGNPSEKLVFKETLQVLKSVLSLDEIEVFPSLQNYIKQELVGSLVDIISGIRLYNKACKKGGAGMRDLPQLMEKAMEAVKQEINNCIDHAVQRAKFLNRLIEKNMFIIMKSNNEWSIKMEFNNSTREIKNWEYTRDLVATHRQLSKTSRILLEAITKLDKHREVLQEQFNGTISTLNQIVIPALYQAVTDVFPYFAELATIWKDFQDDAIRLRGIFNIFKLQAQQIFSLNLDSLLLDKNSVSSSDLPWQKMNDKEELIKLAKDPYMIVHPNTDKIIISKRDLEFNGYCCWVLTNTGGVLVPADLSVGIVEYKKRNYGFCTAMAANCFITNPEPYLTKTIDLARKHVHLIKFLNLEERLLAALHIKTLIEENVEPIVAIASSETQTETHFQDAFIEVNYTWNSWDLKRRLLKQCDLLAKTTRSTQTTRTNLRQPQYTQVWGIRNSKVQTMRNNYGNTKRPSNFIHGLRGIKGNCPFLMDLTEPLSCSSPKLNK